MHNQRGIVWIPILIMVVAVAAFSAMAYFVWQKNIRSTQTEDLTKPPVEHVAKNVNANDVANINGNTNATTSGWKVYTNTKHGYSVQYRQEWTVQERTASYGTNEGDSTAFLLPIVPANPSESNVLSEFVVQVFDRQGSETVDQAFARVRTFSAATVAGIQKEAVKLGGLDATKYTGVPSFASEDDIVAVKGDQVFVLEVNNLTGDNYSTVINSFTFDETLGWKTYTNAAHGYSIRYPQTWSVLEEANARSTQLLPSGVTGTLSGENALNGAITLKYQPTADETNTVINRKDITINSVVAEQGSNPGITGFTATLIPKVDPALKVYWATKYTNAEYNTILSTLQLTDETLGWKKYTNSELGFSFQYPSAMGTVTFSENPGDTGKIFSVGFSNKETTLSLGGMTKDYTAGIEGSFLTTQGYVFDNAKYYNTFVAGRDFKNYPLEPLKVLQVGGQKIILLNQESIVSERNKDPNNSYPPTFGDDKLGALVNFSKKSEFRGMGILDSNTALLPQTTFEAILSTFQFTQ